MQRIFLIGYMGAGKSTLGKALAKEMNLQFIDLDNFIEARQHKTVKDIFATIGQDGFRTLERRALLEVADYEDVIIALGGGTPCFFDNMEVVNRAGTSVYLKPSEEVLHRRLIEGRRKRPIIADKTDEEILQVIREQLTWREPYYQRATITFEASQLESRSQIAASVERLIEMLKDI